MYYGDNNSNLRKHVRWTFKEKNGKNRDTKTSPPISAAIRIPSLYLIPITDVPVTIGYLYQIAAHNQYLKKWKFTAPNHIMEFDNL